PQRLVSLAPNLTELVFALGLGERLVGVGDYDVLPPGAPELPRLGGLLDPNLEALIGLRPDLVLLLPSQQEVADQMQRVGVASLVVAAEDTIADVEEAALAIAARCGVEEAGRELVAGLRRELAPRPGPAKS